MTIHIPYDQVARSAGEDGPYWWACEFPERPADAWTCWYVECDPCHMHSAAAILSDPNMTREFRTGEGRLKGRGRSVEIHKTVDTWRGEVGLPTYSP